MRVYETTFILSPQADDASFDRQIRSVTGLIEKYNGTVLKEDRWGIRRLAYPIKKFTQGFYTRLVFEATNNLLGDLDRFYRLEEAYIRYLTVSYEGKPIEPSEPRPERRSRRRAMGSTATPFSSSARRRRTCWSRRRTRTSRPRNRRPPTCAPRWKKACT